MVVTSFLNGGLTVWWCSKRKTQFFTIVWPKGVFCSSFFNSFWVIVFDCYIYHRWWICGGLCRGYSGAKLTNNIECEIFQVLLEEAKDSYKEEIVVAMKSDSVDDMNRNVATITEWVRTWSSTNWPEWCKIFLCKKKVSHVPWILMTYDSRKMVLHGVMVIVPL